MRRIRSVVVECAFRASAILKVGTTPATHYIVRELTRIDRFVRKVSFQLEEAYNFLSIGRVAIGRIRSLLTRV